MPPERLGGSVPLGENRGERFELPSSDLSTGRRPARPRHSPEIGPERRSSGRGEDTKQASKPAAAGPKRPQRSAEGKQRRIVCLLVCYVPLARLLLGLAKKLERKLV